MSSRTNCLDCERRACRQPEGSRSPSAGALRGPCIALVSVAGPPGHWPRAGALSQCHCSRVLCGPTTCMRCMGQHGGRAHDCPSPQPDYRRHMTTRLSSTGGAVSCSALHLLAAHHPSPSCGPPISRLMEAHPHPLAPTARTWTPRRPTRAAGSALSRPLVRFMSGCLPEPSAMHQSDDRPCRDNWAG